KHQRLNALTTAQFAFSILVESGSIAISPRSPFRRDMTARLAGTLEVDCAVWHMPAAADAVLSKSWRIETRIQDVDDYRVDAPRHRNRGRAREARRVA